MPDRAVTNGTAATGIKPQAAASAVTAVTVAAYVVCGIVAYAAPGLAFGLARLWFHALNIEIVRAATAMSIGDFLLGVVTFGLITWVLTYAAAALYNRLAR